MSIRKYIIKKEPASETIMYLEYKKMKGFNVKPRNKLVMEDMINVDEMVIINPSLIEKLIDKKSARMIAKFFNMLALIDDEDDTAPSDYSNLLDQVARFKSLVASKYIEYMKQEKFKLLMKKLELIEMEVREKQNLLYTYYIEEQTKGKRGR